MNAATAFLICTFVQQNFFYRRYFFAVSRKILFILLLCAFSSISAIWNTSTGCENCDCYLKTVTETAQIKRIMFQQGCVFITCHPFDQMILQIQRDTYQILSSSFLSFLCSSESDVAGEKSERPRTVFLPSVGMSWWGTMVAMAISSNGPFDVSLQLFLPVLYRPALWLQHRFLSIWQRCSF